jgi:hypothetical protein
MSGIPLQLYVPHDKPELRAAALEAWADFKAIVAAPVDFAVPEAETFDEDPGGLAEFRPTFEASPLEDEAEILLSYRFLTNSTQAERRLTLLHECMHAAFAFGTHRERWLKWLATSTAISKSINRMDISTDATRRLQDHAHVRFVAGCRLFQVPEEAVAEQLLKRDYPDWFEYRAKYYLDMRLGQERTCHGRADGFRGLAFFHLHVNAKLFIPLVDGMPEAVQLTRIANEAEEMFQTEAADYIVAFCMNERDHLLSAALDNELTVHDASWRLFAFVNSLEPEQLSRT